MNEYEKGSSLQKNVVPVFPPVAPVTLHGQFGGANSSLSLTEDILARHLLLLGATGSGKTQLLLQMVEQLKQNMSRDDVMIIFDSKADFFENLFDASRDALVGQRPFGYTGNMEIWNIFRDASVDATTESDMIVNLTDITKTLFAERIKNTTNAFFPNSARLVFQDIMLMLWKAIRMGNEEIITRFHNKGLLEEIHMVSDLKDLADALNAAGLGSAATLLKGREASSIFQEVLSLTEDVFVGPFAENGSFSVRNFVKERDARTLFIEYSLSSGEALGGVYSLLLDLAFKQVMGHKTKGNVYVIADEFRLLPSMRHIEDVVHFGRSLGIKMIAAIQSVDNMYANYGENKGRSILSGFSSLVAMPLNDEMSREYVCGRFGKNRIKISFEHTDGEWDEQLIESHTVEDWDITSLKSGDSIVGLAYEKPFLFHFNEYHS